MRQIDGRSAYSSIHGSCDTRSVATRPEAVDRVARGADVEPTTTDLVARRDQRVDPAVWLQPAGIDRALAVDLADTVVVSVD